MKKTIGIILGILVTTSTVFASKIKEDKSTFEIDTKASKVYWTGKKVGGEHSGYLSVANGNVTVVNNEVSDAQVVMDLNSIVCTDLGAGEWNDKLVGHLKSEDFFSVEKFPNAKFEITSIQKNSNNEYNVEGALTLKGVTHEISFPAEIKLENGNVTAKGTATIDRTKWNVHYGSGKFFHGLGDKMIYDDFEITFDITANVAGPKISIN